MSLAAATALARMICSASLLRNCGDRATRQAGGRNGNHLVSVQWSFSQLILAVRDLSRYTDAFEMAVLYRAPRPSPPIIIPAKASDVCVAPDDGRRRVETLGSRFCGNDDC